MLDSPAKSRPFLRAHMIGRNDLVVPPLKEAEALKLKLKFVSIYRVIVSEEWLVAYWFCGRTGRRLS